jgi:hypothetical protein
MKKGSLIFAVALLLITIGLVIPTMSYPFKSRLFPSIALFTILVLLVAQIIKEISALKQAGSREEPSEEEGASRGHWSKHFAIWAWLTGTLIMLWVFGFMGTVLLLPFLYLRSHKESWLLSVALSMGCGIFFYALFGWALTMPLYPGILFSRFFE